MSLVLTDNLINDELKTSKQINFNSKLLVISLVDIKKADNIDNKIIDKEISKKDSTKTSLQPKQDKNSSKDKIISTIPTDKLKELYRLLNHFTRQFNKERDTITNEYNKLYIDNLGKEIRAHSRLQYNCIFWATFYFFGLVYVINRTKMKYITRIGLYAFFFVPNYFYYSNRFTQSKTIIHKQILEDKFKHIKGVEDERKSMLLVTYINYLNNKL